jgi:hypothetical protein
MVTTALVAVLGLVVGFVSFAAPFRVGIPRYLYVLDLEVVFAQIGLDKVVEVQAAVDVNSACCSGNPDSSVPFQGETHYFRMEELAVGLVQERGVVVPYLARTVVARLQPDRRIVVGT